MDCIFLDITLTNIKVICLSPTTLDTKWGRVVPSYFSDLLKKTIRCCNFQGFKPRQKCQDSPERVSKQCLLAPDLRASPKRGRVVKQSEDLSGLKNGGGGRNHHKGGEDSLEGDKGLHLWEVYTNRDPPNIINFWVLFVLLVKKNI